MVLLKNINADRGIENIEGNIIIENGKFEMYDVNEGMAAYHKNNAVNIKNGNISINSKSLGIDSYDFIMNDAKLITNSDF